MPVARVQMPDGRIARLEVPEGTTPQQVESFIFNQENPRPKKLDAFDQSMIEKPSGLARLGRGFSDVTQGVKQGGLMVKDLFTGEDEAGAYTKDIDAEVARYERGRGPDAGMDWMRLGGNVLATAPAIAIPGAGAATLPIRMLTGAGQGAAASGVMYTLEGQSKIGQMAIGGMVGAAVPTVIEGGRRTIGTMFRPNVTVNLTTAEQQALSGELTLKLQKQGVDWNKLAGEVKSSLMADAQKSLSAGGTLDDVMLANKALIESVGAKPTRASVTRAPRDWQTEKNLRGIAGVGDDIVAREQTNAAALTDYLGKLREGTGGKAGTALEAGQSPIAALKAQDKAKEQVVTKLYVAFRASGAQDVEVPAVKIADTLGKVADDIGTENIPGAVLSRLKEFGLTGEKQTKLLTVNEAEKLNRLINNNNPGYGPASKALATIKQAVNESLLDVSVEGRQGVEALTTARAAAAQRFAEQRAGKGITAAIEDVSPDRFVKKFVLDADVRDLRALRAELGKSAEGIQAVKDVKGHLLDNLLMKATGATNADDVAGKAFSGARFGKALDAIAPEKLHILFTPDELASIRTLQKASKLLTSEVPFSDVNYSKTTAALANVLLKIGDTPLLGKLVSPIIGTGKIGMDWVKNAAQRKQVAEILIGSAATSGQKALAAPGPISKFAPGAFATASQGLND